MQKRLMSLQGLRTELQNKIKERRLSAAGWESNGSLVDVVLAADLYAALSAPERVVAALGQWT